MPFMHFPTLTSRISMAIDACALRFDGYKYLETRADQTDPGWIYDLAQRFVETSEFSSDPLENWLAFFSLQRRLGRAMLIAREEESAFLDLYLHLYQEPTPAEFIYPEYHRNWERYRENSGVYAQQIREARLAQSAGAEVET